MVVDPVAAVLAAAVLVEADLVEADLAGTPPIDADCPSVQSIKRIKEKLEEMFGENKIEKNE